MEYEFCPDGWEQRLNNELDLERSFNELSGFEHYHSYTLRGYLRLLQIRTEEALEHFRQAEERYHGIVGDAVDLRRFFLLLALRWQARLLQEITLGSETAREATDLEVDNLLALRGAHAPGTRRLHCKVIGYHHLVRRRFTEALEEFEKLIEEARATPEVAVVSYMGAAAATHELGLYKESRRHYENTELCMAFNESKLALALFAATLTALCKHWGWNREASRWEATIDVLPGPATLRESLHERSRLIFQGCQAGAFAFV